MQDLKFKSMGSSRQAYGFPTRKRRSEAEENAAASPVCPLPACRVPSLPPAPSFYSLSLHVRLIWDAQSDPGSLRAENACRMSCAPHSACACQLTRPLAIASTRKQLAIAGTGLLMLSIFKTIFGLIA